jgi:hypothetical protein
MKLHPTGQRRVDDPIPARPLGKKQESILRSLREHTYWSANCGWIHGTHSRTVKLLESLIPRGLVVRAEEPTGHTGTLAALYGKTRVTYRPTYGAAKPAQEAATAPQEAATPRYTVLLHSVNLVAGEAVQTIYTGEDEYIMYSHVSAVEFTLMACYGTAEIEIVDAGVSRWIEYQEGVRADIQEGK